MSTPLLPEVVPEIDANPVSFYSGGGGWVVGHQKQKGFQLQGLCPLTSLTRGSACGPHCGFADNRLDAVPPTTVLTFMVQSVCGDFRDIVAFFPIYQLTEQDEAKYVRDSIAVIERNGLFVRCVVCDNSKVNQTMIKDFGIVTQD